MSRISSPRQVAAWVLLLSGLLAVGYAAHAVIDARAYQATARRRLEQVRPDAAAAPELVDGAPIGELLIPRLGLAAIIAQGDAPEVLERAIGHLADTALPGEPGNVVLAGHRDTFFRPLRYVRIGDAITLKTPSGAFEYRVESTTVVPPTAVEVLEPTGGRTLTLITCFPFSYLGSAPERFIVLAREIDARAGPARGIQ